MAYKINDNAVDRYYLNGKDLVSVFHVHVKSGSDDFLKFPKRKESTTHDWLDSDGVEVDLSRPFFEPREFTLKCFIRSNSVSGFWNDYNAFLFELRQAEELNLTIKELGKNFKVYYKENPYFHRLTPIINAEIVYCEFDIVFGEQKPEFDNSINYIVTHAGEPILCS